MPAAASGRCEVDFMGRMSELQRRNSLMPPHLRSCYAPEINVPGQASALMSENELRVSWMSRAWVGSLASGLLVGCRVH